MHRRLLNSMRLAVTLRPRGPILIQGSDQASDPTRPDMAFLRTRHPDLGETIFLPGSSLKGAIRAHAEAALRGLDVPVCDPFDRETRCSDEDASTTAAVYKQQCPACRTFGSLALAGRVDLGDALPWPADAEPAEREAAAARANATETRPHVGIDRRTGAAQGSALYQSEVAVAGAFHAEVRLRNVELWQLGLVVATLRELDAGFFGLGHGKARGQGQVSVTFDRLDVETTRHADSARRLLGVAALVSNDDRTSYGLVDPAHDRVDLPDGCTPRQTWNGHRLSVDGSPLATLLDRVVDRPLADRFAVDLSEEAS